jgi:hypothetical protein
VTIVRAALQIFVVVICALSASPAFAQDATSAATAEPAPDVAMQSPRVSFYDADWGAARAAVISLDQAATQDQPAATPDILARLNTAAEKILPKISVSPVPVLLPFDTGTFLRDQAQGTAGDTGKYFSGFLAPTLFFPGPSGYDAEFSLPPENLPGLDLTFAKHVDVLISGSSLLYDLDSPALSDVSPVPELANDFPDLRRVLLEERLRYTFTRFGVPYVVAIGCNDGPTSARRLSCREADKVAVRFLKALNVAGGAPQAVKPVAAQTIDPPQGVSPEFTYYAPGDLLPGTGMKGQNGRADPTVYAAIRYPMQTAPSYVNSQSFMNWGDCNLTGRVSLPRAGKTAAYHCRANSIPLVEDESKNYTYPWRDNFCEHRDYYVGQCPAGLGHQGEDIRPSSCLMRDPDSGRCIPYEHNLVAVHDGVLMRNPGDEALYLVVDSRGEHIRFRYLHMNPQMLDASGMVNGRLVSEGEVIGTVDNYGHRQAGTSYHMHFNEQVFTRDGWVFVNPYMTLVAAYERLIGGRGRVVRDVVATTASTGALAVDGHAQPPAATPPTDATLVPAPPSAIVAPEKSESGESKTVSAEHCQTRYVKGHRRRFCEPDGAGRSERGRHVVRSVDRDVSR